MSHDTSTKNSNEMMKITASNAYCLIIKYLVPFYVLYHSPGGNIGVPDEKTELGRLSIYLVLI